MEPKWSTPGHRQEEGGWTWAGAEAGGDKKEFLANEGWMAKLSRQKGGREAATTDV